jgi:hypothetical protein
MQKVEGVEKVRVSLKEGLTILDLRQDNKVTLTGLRTIIRNNGFVSKAAEVVARGTPRAGEFEVSGTGERIKAQGPPKESGGQYRFTALAP